MPAPANNKRRRVLLVLLLVFAAAGLGYWAWWTLHGRYHATTDDAYVAGNLIRVTPRVGGTVIAVLGDDTDYVKEGQVLVRLDSTDARVGLERAQADLAEAVRRVRQAYELVEERQAGLALKQQALAQAEADLARRGGAAAEHEAVSKEEVDHARRVARRAQDDARMARAQLAGAQAAVAGTTLDAHPSVRAAAARVREAFLTLARCEIRAASNGYLARRSVQVGQQVTAGAPLMALVPLDQLWAEVNFKEDQLARLRIGQPVELVSDFYGDDAVFHGKVVGVQPGTGGVFSLLPPQNASGNWIKIVQRLPVRVSLEPAELARHPLRVGLSLRADVDTHEQGGAVLGNAAGAGQYATPVYEGGEREADALVRKIIAANRGA